MVLQRGCPSSSVEMVFRMISTIKGVVCFSFVSDHTFWSLQDSRQISQLAFPRSSNADLIREIRRITFSVESLCQMADREARAIVSSHFSAYRILRV